MKTIVTEGKVVEVTDEAWGKIEAVLLADKSKYQFKAGDVVDYGDSYGDSYHSKRIIIETRDGNLEAISCEQGINCCGNGQSSFEDAGYKKIGVISDFIK
ncbi:MAG: hypothetical protein ACYS1A_19070 [Planctomycetota bacterium]|jgi:hypothetical protein